MYFVHVGGDAKLNKTFILCNVKKKGRERQKEYWSTPLWCDMSRTHLFQKLPIHDLTKTSSYLRRIGKWYFGKVMNYTISHKLKHGDEVTVHHHAIKVYCPLYAWTCIIPSMNWYELFLSQNTYRIRHDSSKTHRIRHIIVSIY